MGAPAVWVSATLLPTLPSTGPGRIPVVCAMEGRVSRLPSLGMPHLPCGLCDSSWHPAHLPQSLGKRLASGTTCTATLPSCAGSALPPGLDSSLPRLGRVSAPQVPRTLPRSAPSLGFHAPMRSGCAWRPALMTPFPHPAGQTSQQGWLFLPDSPWSPSALLSSP